MSKEHWKIKKYFSVLFLRTWRSGILFQPNITIFDIYMKGKTCMTSRKMLVPHRNTCAYGCYAFDKLSYSHKPVSGIYQIKELVPKIVL